MRPEAPVLVLLLALDTGDFVKKTKSRSYKILAKKTLKELGCSHSLASFLLKKKSYEIDLGILFPLIDSFFH